MDFDIFCKHRVLTDFSERDRAELREKCRKFEFIGEDKLCEQGRPTRGLYFVCEGKLRISQRRDSEHEDQVITYLNAPTVVGEMELLSGRSSVSTVTADEPVIGYILEHSTFQDLLNKGRPAISKMLRNVGQVLVLRLVAANKRFLKLKDPDLTPKNIHEALNGFWEHPPEG